MKKKIIALLALAVFLSFQPAFRASAMGRDTFILDDGGGVALDAPHGAEEGIASLRFSLKVDAADAKEVSFRFAGLSAEVQEYRYHADSHNLNIYIAGSEALFKDGQEPLDMGRVVVLDASQKEAEARISVVENSLVYVYGTEMKQADKVVLPDSVIINASENQDVLETPPADSGSEETKGDSSPDSDDGGENDGDSGSGSGSSDSGGSDHGGGDWQEIENGGLIVDGIDNIQGSGAGAGTGTGTGGQTGITTRPGTGTGVIGTGNKNGDGSPAPSENYTKLQQLLQRVQAMKESDYTSESFAALQKAADEARHVLENTSSTDQDLADALMELENAVGALVRKEDITVVEPESEEETTAAEEIPVVEPEDVKSKGSLLPVILIVILVAAAGGGTFFVLYQKGIIGKTRVKRDGKWRDITGKK